MTDFAAREAKRALQRLRRAVEKAEQELEAVAGALRHAEAGDFPADAFAEAAERLAAVETFIDDSEVAEDRFLKLGDVRRDFGCFGACFGKMLDIHTAAVEVCVVIVT